MIYVTGDLHGFVGLSRLKDWREGRAGDYLIVAGDFGYPWDFSEEEGAEIAWLESRPYRVLFVDGNHERFDHWTARPAEPWGGGMVQRLSDGSPIMRLMRSEVYEIDGARIFTLGGAASIDQAYRTPYVDWWPHEVPTEQDFDEARANLDAVGWKVDYVIDVYVPQKPDGAHPPPVATHIGPSGRVPDEVFGRGGCAPGLQALVLRALPRGQGNRRAAYAAVRAIVPIGAGVDG